MPSKKKSSCKDRMKKCFLFLCNPRRKLFCNKTCRQWAQYILYYGGFFCLIFIIFIVLSVMVLWNFARFDIPWQQFKILKAPAISVRPPTLDHLVAYNENNNIVLVERMNKFYRKYKDFNPDYYQDCSGTTKKEKQCFFNLTDLGPCGREPFGYDGKHLCIVLKINKVYGWTPQSGTSKENFPHLLTDQFSRKNGFLKVSCKPLKPLDRENLKELDIFPKHGFPEHFFPITNRYFYLQPLVAVYFSGMTTDLLITIACNAKREDLLVGSVVVEIMIGHSSVINYNKKKGIV